MLLIVSVFSCGETVLLFSLLLRLGLGVLDGLSISCCSDSLPNITRAFSETWSTARTAFWKTWFRLWHEQEWDMLPKLLLGFIVLNYFHVLFSKNRCLQFWMIHFALSWAKASLDLCSAEVRERGRNTQYSLQASKLHLPLHIELINP